MTAQNENQKGHQKLPYEQFLKILLYGSVLAFVASGLLIFSVERFKLVDDDPRLVIGVVLLALGLLNLALVFILTLARSLSKLIQRKHNKK